MSKKLFTLQIMLALGMCLASPMLWAEYGVQVAAYPSNKASLAIGEVNSLSVAGFPADMQNAIINGSEIIRVIVGPFPNRREALDALARLKAAGKDGYLRKYNHVLAADPPPSPLSSQGDAPAKSPLSPAPENPSPLPGEAVTAITMQEQLRQIPASSEAPQSQSESDVATKPETADEDLLPDKDIGMQTSPRPTGFFQSELAYAESSPQHLSKFRNTLEVASQGRFSANMAWKVSGRIAYDAVFDLNDFYPTSVKDDQQVEKSLRETYVDISANNWDFRLGRQHIIWGEMVGLFFADVVSAKDLREFVLPEFNMLRIPQWAARSEYFKGDFHGEAIWIPYPTYDNIGVPGAEFYPYPTPPPPGYEVSIADERRPAGSLADSNYGLRFSYLVSGWDLSAFYYSSMDASPTFFREVVTLPVPAFIYRPDHTRIQQVGGTLSQELLGAVLKGEVIYTHDRWFEVNQLSDIDGVVRQDTLDYVAGLEYSLPQSSRLNIQFFQRWFPDHDPATSAKQVESGASLYLSSTLLDGKLEPQLLAIASLNRGDWMARPKLVWGLDSNWRWVLGADIFGGSREGLFGRYGDKDRVYTELRYAF